MCGTHLQSQVINGRLLCHLPEVLLVDLPIPNRILHLPELEIMILTIILIAKIIISLIEASAKVSYCLEWPNRGWVVLVCLVVLLHSFTISGNNSMQCDAHFNNIYETIYSKLAKAGKASVSGNLVIIKSINLV